MKSLLAIAMTATALLAAPDAMAGKLYKVAGTNLDGSPYSGQADITLTSETTCGIKWTTGSTESTGICMRNGDAFAAGYVLGTDVGLVVYQVKQDGSLDGVWTIAGKSGAGTEVLTPE